MLLTGQNYIAGELSAEGADAFYSVDPRSEVRWRAVFPERHAKRSQPRR